jgi:hypothetical protein
VISERTHWISTNAVELRIVGTGHSHVGESEYAVLRTKLQPAGVNFAHIHWLDPCSARGACYVSDRNPRTLGA